ncbi:glycosyltransferase [Providencia stuartii]|uniref:glycosyltransferase n=1 Tax=Providencia stuartii TaxID=588 RepID=UPI0034E4236B
MKLPKVAVILSSYNGEKYIKEQIDSILAQKNIELDLYIRDDGSTDSTVKIVNEYIKKHNNIFLYAEPNVGVTHSFFKLIELLENKMYDYYSLADQDDFWLDYKLYNAINLIDNEIPTLVCDSYYITNEDLVILDSKILKKDYTFSELLIQGVFPGCTMLFNYKLYSLILDSLKDEHSWLTGIHDNWIVKIAKSFGALKTNPIPSIYYRQHSNNAIGNSFSFKRKITNSLKNTITSRKKHSFLDEIYLFKIVFSSKLSADINSLFEQFINIDSNVISRIKFILNNSSKKDTVKKTLFFRVRVLLGFYKLHIEKFNRK